MKLTGILKKPIIDYDTLRPMLVFASNEDFSQAYEELKGYDKLSHIARRGALMRMDIIGL